MGMKLFENDENENVDVSKIEIDERFARRYEHNKKREALQRYQELKKKGEIDSESSDSESSSDSEEDEAEIKKLSKKKYFEELISNLIKVKERDPSIYQKDVNFFESESNSDDATDDDDDDDNSKENKKKKKKKAVYLKDVTAQQLIEEGPEFEEEEEGESSNAKKKKTYIEEQEELKRAFLDAAKDVEVDSDDGDLLRVKEKKDVGIEEKEKNDAEFQEKLRKYFGVEEELDEKDKFLKEFIAKQLWIDKENKDKGDVDDDDVDELLRDDEEIEKQEKYEEAYNFRHEENVGDRVMGHSRIVEGSVRKIENARKEQRKSKKERMKIAEMERKEELKHMKNLKKKEMKEMLMKIMKTAGVSEDNAFGLDLDDLKKDFDPEEHDKMMKEAFNEEYFNADDVDAEFGSGDDGADLDKPDFDKEDELLGLPKGWDVVDHEGFLATRDKLLKQESENVSDDDDKEEEEETERNKKSKRKRKRKMSLLQKVKEEMLEEYYKLDYEGTVGDLKTRFKYAKVQPEKYGLKTEEILILDDQELNQYVSVKKLAPYRESEWKVNKTKKDQLKQRIRELPQERPKHQKNNKKNNSKDDGGKSAPVVDSRQNGKEELQGSNVEMEKLSRKAKRKRNQAEYKLTQSRILAYQNMQSKAKGKGKH